MHRGVQSLIGWLEQNRTKDGVVAHPAATGAELSALEDRILSPLPEDLRQVLGRSNGAKLPSGLLLSAQGDEGNEGDDSIQGALTTLSKALDRPVEDTEMLLPFFRNDDGGILAFDRSAGPVADTWPVVDYYPDSGELRLVHRTFDGFCRFSVAVWTAVDFADGFSLEKYLSSGERHATHEPDVSVAHATVAHALRRAGRPEDALAHYLRAGRCVPALVWCDWEALKLSTLLGEGRSAIEAAGRLCARAPQARWKLRETVPEQVADVLAHLAPSIESREALLRLFDQLADQATDSEGRAHITALRKAYFAGKPLPEPRWKRRSVVDPSTTPEVFGAAVLQAYQDGKLRDEALLLDPIFAGLRKGKGIKKLLRTPRPF